MPSKKTVRKPASSKSSVKSTGAAQDAKADPLFIRRKRNYRIGGDVQVS